MSIAPNISAGEAPWSHELNESITALTWLKHGLAVGTADGELLWLERDAEALVSRGHIHQDMLLQLSPHPKNAMLASAGGDGRVLLLDMEKETPPRVLLETKQWVEHLAWSPDGRYLAAAAGREWCLWHSNGEAAQQQHNEYGAVAALAWNAGGTSLLVGAYRKLQNFIPERKQAKQQFDFPAAPSALAWSPDGKCIAAGSQDKLLLVWRKEAQGRFKQFTMRGYLSKVNALAWSENGRYLTGAGGRDVVIWDVRAPKVGGRPPKILRRHQRTITHLAFRPGGKEIASADRGGELILWDAAGQARQIHQAGSEINALQWRGDGTALAVGTQEGILSIIDAQQRA